MNKWWLIYRLKKYDIKFIKSLSHQQTDIIWNQIGSFLRTIQYVKCQRSIIIKPIGIYGIACQAIVFVSLTVPEKQCIRNLISIRCLCSFRFEGKKHTDTGVCSTLHILHTYKVNRNRLACFYCKIYFRNRNRTSFAYQF